MEIEQLKTFLVVAELGSITKAADQLFLTKSSVIKRLKELENELGAPLLKRSGRMLDLTPEGEAYFPYAKQMVLITEKAKRQMSKRSEPKGIVKLATTSNFCTYVLTSWLQQFRFLFPLIEVDVITEYSRPTIDKVLNASIDVGIIKGPFDHKGLRIFPIYHEKIIPVIPPNHPWCGQEHIPVQSLADHPLIVSDRFSSTWEGVAKWLRDHNIPIHIVMDLDQVESCKLMVQKGLGIAFLPISTVEQELLRGELGTFTPDPPLQKYRQTDLIINRNQALPYHISELVNFFLQMSALSRRLPNGSQPIDNPAAFSQRKKL